MARFVPSRPALVAAAAAALVLSGCFCAHRSHALSEWKPGEAERDSSEAEPADFAALLDRIDRECAAGRSPRLGLCEKRGAEFAWTERRGVIWSKKRAFSLADGKLVYAEDRSWSDVAICLPDIVDRWGSPPPCEPVYMSVCGATGDLRKRYLPGTAPTPATTP